MPSARQTWRLIVTPPASGAENMALDEALMDRARQTGEWVLRIYSWSAPTISLGRNQSARGRYDLDRIQTLGLAVVRRPTGGRAILHDREITYSVTAPVGDAGELHESYHRINRLLLHGLRSLGVAATVASPTTRSAAPSMAPCFNEPSAGELTLDGRKLAGSAQWRSADALLQHGSILVADDQSLLATLAREGPSEISRPATLSDALGAAPEFSNVAAALADAVRDLEDANARELVLEDELRARALALVVRYVDDAWTWRR
jgi:lipoyl(octanoyl) transferase